MYMCMYMYNDYLVTCVPSQVLVFGLLIKAAIIIFFLYSVHVHVVN